MDEIDLQAEREGRAIYRANVKLFAKPRGFVRRNGQSSNACRVSRCTNRTTFFQRRPVSIG